MVTENSQDAISMADTKTVEELLDMVDASVKALRNSRFMLGKFDSHEEASEAITEGDLMEINQIYEAMNALNMIYISSFFGEYLDDKPTVQDSTV